VQLPLGKQLQERVKIKRELYSPVAHDMKDGGLQHFRKNSLRGEPVKV